MEVYIPQVQPKVFSVFLEFNIFVTVSANSPHHGLNVFPKPIDRFAIFVSQNRALCFPSRVPYIGAKQLHYLHMVLPRMFLG